jgi:hypothetical protein
MAEEVSANTGPPVLLQRPGPLVWGLSTKAVAHGEPVPVVLWLYNPTNTNRGVGTCDINDFYSSGIDVFDSSGHRVSAVSEQPAAQDPHTVNLPLRSCFGFAIPPHTCMHGSFSQPGQFGLVRDLLQYYSLPPGRYVIVASERDQAGNPVARTLSNPQNGLRVEVE